MSSADLTQAEADKLLAMPKQRLEAGSWRLPAPGGKLSTLLTSTDQREQFVLDQYRGRIRMTKGSNQNRARRTVVLARLCFDSSFHRNPDGTEVGPTHLHLYREGFGDKWAVEAPPSVFGDRSGSLRTLVEFLEYCQVVDLDTQEPSFF